MKESEFITLVNAYLDHEITVEELHRLKKAVDTSAAHRRLFAQYRALHLATQAALADRTGEPAPLEEETSEGKVIAVPRSTFRRALPAATAVAASLLLGFFALPRILQVGAGHEPVAGTPDAPPAPVRVAAAEAPSPAPAPGRADVSLARAATGGAFHPAVHRTALYPWERSPAVRIVTHGAVAPHAGLLEEGFSQSSATRSTFLTLPDAGHNSFHAEPASARSVSPDGLPEWQLLIQEAAPGPGLEDMPEAAFPR